MSYNIQKLAIISLVGLYILFGIEMHEKKINIKNNIKSNRNDMKISDTITEKILTDNNFSMELAKKIGIQQGSLLSSIRRNRDSRILRLWEAVMFYKEQGYTEEEIFTDYIENQNVIKDKKNE